MKKLILLIALLAPEMMPTSQCSAGVIFGGTPVNLGTGVNTEFSEVAPSLTDDGLTIFFSSNRPGGIGDHDLYMATRTTTTGAFGTAVNLGNTINSSFSDLGGDISSDGLTLYFTSTRASSTGQGDIFVSSRASLSDPWGTPVLLSSVSSSLDDGSPDISADGLTLYFQSLRSGTYSIWSATRASVNDPFGAPTLLGSPISSTSRDGGPNISPDNLTLFFDSARPGGIGGRSIYSASRSSITDPFGDVKLVDGVNSIFGAGQPFLTQDKSALYFQSAQGFGDSDLWVISAIPEPSSFILLCMGAASVMGFWWIRDIRFLRRRSNGLSPRVIEKFRSQEIGI